MDLFDQLKSSGPPNQTHTSPAKTSPSIKSNHDSTVEQFNEKHISKSSSARRESLPSPLTVSSGLKKIKTNKARSLSPPKFGVNNTIKSLKIKLERKKFEEFLTRPLEEHANNIRNKQEKQHKITPTKAQQKLFEPLVGQRKTQLQLLKEFNIKPCKVRIHRDNLQKLAREFKRNAATRKDNKSKNNKRPATEYLDEIHPSKKGKITAVDFKNNKVKNNLFFKFNTSSSSSKVEKKFRNLPRNSTTSSPSSSTVAQHNKIKNSKFNTITTPTKFSRSHLISSFGKRFFNVQVKIERCTHPLMLTFESNDRARRLQAKRNNKSKNLSVSFREQVEIFGGSSDSDDSCDEDFCAVPNRNNRKNNTSQSNPVPTTPVVMPARLKKVENGKVVDDIELDPSLFVDPKILVSSTPFSPGRKKRDHKSFSPLKDESSPSPRKEQLKLANERIPPTGLRRLNIDEEDDEDDDCEYIVPIDMPQRRISRTSSASPPVPIYDTDVVIDNLDLTPYTKINIETNNTTNTDKDEQPPISTELNLENGSEDSFQSAKDNLRVSPSQDNNDDDEQLQQTNGNGCNNDSSSSKHLNTINTMEDISMNLFLDDSHEGDTNAKSFVDSLINETIDKLSKDIEEGTNTT
ncbi:uncharacterized protein ACRADG_006559 [Cochliomyia hominivorax]